MGGSFALGHNKTKFGREKKVDMIWESIFLFLV
jgi:hypothetical protein